MTHIIEWVLGVVIVAFVWSIGMYNLLIGLIETINNDKKQIDIQLDRRYKVFESLIESVKKYMDYEQTTLKDVVALRNQAQKAKQTGNDKARMQAEDGISNVVSGLNLVFEQYPDLKANQNVLQLQEEIVNTENKLAFAKQAYNDAIERYNAKKKSFFQSMVVAMCASKLDKDFTYWSLSDTDIAKKENYTVKL